MAFECCQELTHGQSLSNNFLMLVSGSGLGKSHLAQAVASESAEDADVCYQTAQDFSRHYVDSLNRKSYATFSESYRRYQVYILEDIPFFATKPKFEIEICAALEYLLNKGAKVILTSTQPLKHIPGLSPKCRSRLSQALITTISPPDYETRLSILTKLVKKKGYNIIKTVLEEIAEVCPPDVRTLYSTLDSLQARARAERKLVDLAMAKDFLVYVNHPPDNGESFATIKKIISEAYRVDERALVSSSRSTAIAEARAIGIYLARHLFNHSFPEIGKAFNRRHSTAMYNYNKIVSTMETDSKLKRNVEYLSQLLGKAIPLPNRTAS
jgi:chromosomal replication initiator protein